MPGRWEEAKGGGVRPYLPFCTRRHRRLNALLRPSGERGGDVLFPVDKIKDARVVAPGRGKHGSVASSDCLLLLSLQAYLWLSNPVET